MKWEKVSLENISTRIGDGLHGTPKYEDSGEFYFINGNNLVNGKILIKNDTKRISSIEYDKIKKELGEKTVLVAINGTLGNVGLYQDEPVALGKSACYINVNEKAEKIFVKYVLENTDFQIYARDFATGATIKNLGLKAIREYSFSLPPLPTQCRIASILSAYDDLIENNLKRIKLLEEKAFLMYKGIVKSEKKLKICLLAELATVTSSKRIFLSDYVDEGIPFYRSKEIIAKSNFESIEKPLYITEERYSDIKEKFGVPVSGDLLITSVGTIGFVHLVNDDDGDFYFKDGNLIWIKNLFQLNLAYFLFFKFRTPEFKEMLNSVAIGSSQKALTIETVKKIEIEIPSNDSLIEFNQETKSIIKFIYNLQKQNTKLSEARDILLPRLMSGEIEV